MKEFACGDVVPGCSARFFGPTDDDILGQVGAHAAADHGMTEIPDDVIASVRSLIRSA